jgi:hypothetical protein
MSRRAVAALPEAVTDSGSDLAPHCGELRHGGRGQVWLRARLGESL